MNAPHAYNVMEIAVAFAAECNYSSAAHATVYLYVFLTVLICPYATVYVDLGSESELFLHLNNTLKVSV